MNNALKRNTSLYLFILALVALTVTVIGIAAALNRFSGEARPAAQVTGKNYVHFHRVVVVDLETTGLHPDRHEIIEIGAIKIAPGTNHHETFMALIRPKKALPKIITQITGITQEMLDESGEPLAQVIPQFLSFVGQDRLVAHNADFDISFLKNAALKVGQRLRNSNSCTLKMARRAWPKLQSYKLSDLATGGNLDTQGNHRALKDCELTAVIYFAAARKLRLKI